MSQEKKSCKSCGINTPIGNFCDATKEDGNKCKTNCIDMRGFIYGSLVGEWDDQKIVMDLCKEDFERAIKFLGSASRIEYTTEVR